MADGQEIKVEKKEKKKKAPMISFNLGGGAASSSKQADSKASEDNKPLFAGFKRPSWTAS